jgi:hypothetical protein
MFTLCHTLTLGMSHDAYSTVEKLCFSVDGQYVASMCGSKVYAHDVETSKLVWYVSILILCHNF